MISREKVFSVAYTCFHCEKEINFDHKDFYVLTFGKVYHAEAFNNSNETGKQVDKRIVFHKECWSEVAGEDYMFSGPETK